MLCLTRKVGQSIIIDTGDDIIEIVVTRQNHGSVGIGIKAPPHMTITRPDAKLKTRHPHVADGINDPFLPESEDAA